MVDSSEELRVVDAYEGFTLHHESSVSMMSDFAVYDDMAVKVKKSRSLVDMSLMTISRAWGDRRDSWIPSLLISS